MSVVGVKWYYVGNCCQHSKEITLQIFVTYFAANTTASIVPYFVDCSECKLFFFFQNTNAVWCLKETQKLLLFIIPVTFVYCQHYRNYLLIRTHSDYFTICTLSHVLYFEHILRRDVNFILKIFNKWATLIDFPARRKAAKVVMLSNTGCILPVS